MSDVLTFESVEESLLCFLDTLDQNKRVEMIDDLIHRLNFERRFTLLTDEERTHMLDESLSPNQRVKLDKVKDNRDAFDELIRDFARTRYFRKCAWIDYLNGVNAEKPWSSPCRHLDR